MGYIIKGQEHICVKAWFPRRAASCVGKPVFRAAWLCMDKWGYMRGTSILGNTTTRTHLNFSCLTG